jgi:uncharacterized protein (TIGR03437 family)
VAAGSLKNAASFATEVAVAPGGLVSVFGASLADGETAVDSSGTLPRELGGTTVMLGGRPLALSYASAGQINAQLPSDLNTDTQHQIYVQRGDAISVPSDVIVAPARPAIFSKDQTGRGQGVILKEDGSYAEPASPAAHGEVVRLFCAGLGKTDPPVPQGETAPGPNRTMNSVAVTIGGISAEVRSAGLSVSLPGVYEVLVVIPAEIERSDEVSVVISVGGQLSPTVTMAVR